MRILLLGNISGNLDEGMKNTTFYLQRELSKHHEVQVMNPRRAFFPSTIKMVRAFKPDIIHYVHGPTIRSLLLIRWFSKWVPEAKTVASATRPYFSLFSRFLIRFLKPDLVLTQSFRFEEFFRKYGCKVTFLPNGVDIRKFKPVSQHKKLKFRTKYGVPEDLFVVLHVGHIKNNRNLEVLADIQRLDGNQVVVVGGTSMPMDVEAKIFLEKAGCMVWRRYFEDIAEIYALADCFVFPTKDAENGKLPKRYNQIGCIDLPLSVLEAMACNLPVLCTKFGALPRIFEEGRGMLYFENKLDITRKLCLLKKGMSVNTRRMIEGFSWNEIEKRLEQEYRELVSK